jgi:hypothetical protein
VTGIQRKEFTMGINLIGASLDAMTTVPATPTAQTRLEPRAAGSKAEVYVMMLPDLLRSRRSSEPTAE